MVRRNLTPAQRLVLAADFTPADQILPGEEDVGNVNHGWRRDAVRQEVLSLAEEIQGTGVCLKINSALRACGYRLIDDIHRMGLEVFADLKYFDIGATLATDGIYLNETRPELVTVACATGVSAMQTLKAQLPHTEVLGVTALTTLTNADTDAMFTCTTEEAVMRFARVAKMAGLDGLISAATEAAPLRAEFGMLFTLNTPAIRPKCAPVAGDDQNPDRSMTPEKAMEAGVDRIVVGRPITQAKNRRDAVLRTIDEIAGSLERLQRH